MKRVYNSVVGVKMNIGWIQLKRELKRGMTEDVEGILCTDTYSCDVCERMCRNGRHWWF